MRFEAEELAETVVRSLGREIDVYRQPHGKGASLSRSLGVSSKTSMTNLLF